MKLQAKPLLFGIFLFTCMILFSSCIPDSAGFGSVKISYIPGTPPEKIYVDRFGYGGPFEVAVRTRNNGNSLAKGGLYITGYDTGIINFSEIKPGKFFDNCRYDLAGLGFADGDFRNAEVDAIGFGRFNALFQCERLKLGGLNTDGLGISVVNYGDDFGLLFDINNLRFPGLGGRSFDIQFQLIGDEGRIDIDFNDPNFDPTLGARGPFFLSLWAPFDFSRNNGIPFLLQNGVPIPDEKFITFHGTVDNVPALLAQTTQDIVVTSCYLYTTHAAITVCIDYDPHSQNAKACRPKIYEPRGKENGVVGLVSVSQRNVGNQIVFRLVFENLGKGVIYNPMRIDSCSPYYPLPPDPDDTDIAILGMVYLGGEYLTCYPTGSLIRFQHGRAIVDCVYDLTGGPNPRLTTFSGAGSVLMVELWYGYSEVIKAEMDLETV